MLCSPALRARETLALLGDAAGAAQVTVDEALYAATAADLLRRLQALGQDVSPVLLVGHNPAVQELVHALTGANPGFAAGALAILETPPWPALGAGTATLRGLLTSQA